MKSLRIFVNRLSFQAVIFLGRVYVHGIDFSKLEPEDKVTIGLWLCRQKGRVGVTARALYELFWRRLKYDDQAVKGGIAELKKQMRSLSKEDFSDAIFFAVFNDVSLCYRRPWIDPKES